MSGSAAPPVFYYDFNSPYAYFVAQRVNDVLPVRPRWQPFSFGFLLLATKRVPWSLGPARDAGMAVCERIADERGLPPIKWPVGWPDENYSITALRGALVASRHGLLEDYSRAAFAEVFQNGQSIQSEDATLDIAESIGMDRAATAHAIGTPEIKDELRALTDQAVAMGVIGVPTIDVAGQLFWGDDQLENAAHAFAGFSSKSL